MLELEQADPGAYYFYDQWFLRDLSQRGKLEYNTLGAFTGKPGRGKSVAAYATCLALDPNFKEEQIVFTPQQFKNAIQNTKPGAWIWWDEPNKGLSHQDWYQQMNKAVTRFLQTSRFREKNVLFALPKLDLLSKAARPVLLFEGIFWTRKVCSVYELEPNHFGSTPELYKNFQGEAEFVMPSRDKWNVYLDKRERWHEKEFPDEEFTQDEKPEESRKYVAWEEVYEQVKTDPDKFRDLKRHNMVTPLLVSSITGCSDQTARKVIRRITLEKLEHE